jgi:riboflavin kinase/FMN adenylyltransferase
MKVVSSLSDADVPEVSVVSIGNFDGLHLGHREILKTVVQRARELGVKSVAMSFSPHPVRFLAPDRAPKLISSFDQKIRLIENTGIDVLFLVHFDAAFSKLSPSDFVKQYLIDGLKARAICVGNNFNFGYRQQGTVETLKEFSASLEVIEVPPVRVRGTLASSSRVRSLISAGAVSRACRLLGRWIELEGELVGGAGRGRSETVPTLNLKAGNELIPKMGVYITRISLDGHPFMDSVTNIGVRPTFGENDLTIETFVLHDPVPAAASSARLDFLRRLRDEVKFESPEALRTQITADVKRAKKFFRLLRNPSPSGRGLGEGIRARHHSN